MTFSRTEKTPEDRRTIAIVLSSFGCHPKISLRAAHEIIETGHYSTRLKTAAAICRNLQTHLREAGIGYEIEDLIPEGNYDHARDDRNSFKRIETQPYPADKIIPLIDDLLEQELETSPALRM